MTFDGLKPTFGWITNRVYSRFEFQNLNQNKKFGILIPKLYWPTVRKKYSRDQDKLLKFEAEGWEFEKKIEITRTIYSNSDIMLF